MKASMSFFTQRKWLVPTLAISALLLVILLALGMFGGVDKVGPGTTALTKQTLPTQQQLFVVGKQLSGDDRAWQGSVRSRVAVRLAPKLSARIVEIPVNAGDTVKKGDLIARLDDRDLRAAYNAANAAQLAAQAQAMQATSEERRTTDLYNKQAATRQNYEVVLAQAQAARAVANQAASNAQQAKVLLSENVLIAPFDGIVSQRLQEPGDMAQPSQAVVLLHKPEDLRFEVAIADHCLGQIKLGAAATVNIDGIDKQFSGRIDEIAPASDPQTRTRQIKIALPQAADLRQGLFGWLALSCVAEQPILTIPESALIHYGQLQAVKIVDQERISIRHVRTGKRIGDRLEVLSGLHEGDSVLINPGLQP